MLYNEILKLDNSLTEKTFDKILDAYASEKRKPAPILPKKEKNTCKVFEKVTLYTNSDNSLFYAKNYDITRFELHSANSPCMIGNTLCYRISISDVQKLIKGENNNTSPYKIDLVIVEKNNKNNKPIGK